MFLQDGTYSSALHHDSYLSVGVPGTVAGLALAWRENGRLPWRRLVEPAIALGGLAATLDEVFPGMECASCFLQPALDEVLHHPSIEVLTGAELLDVRGSHGNLAVRVRVRPRRVDERRSEAPHAPASPGTPVTRSLTRVAASVAEVRRSPAAHGGMAPVYGMAGSLPFRGVVGDLLGGYLDVLSEP